MTLVNKPFNIALVGGGKDTAFFGKQHFDCVSGMRRLGFEVSHGVLSSNPDNSMKYALNWRIRGVRTTKDLAEMAANTSYAVVATPNAAHFDDVKLLLQAGIPVLCEKPITLTLAQAKELATLSVQRQVPFAAAYTYRGYWAATLMKKLIRSSRLGNVRSFVGLYLQGWQTHQLGIDQEWRRQKGQSGEFNSTGDISTHLVELICSSTGLDLSKVVCMTNSFPDDPSNDDGLDNDSNVIAVLTKSGPVKPQGIVKSTQIAVGHSNDIGIQIFCEGGSVHWSQLSPEKLTVSVRGRAPFVCERGEGLSGEILVDDLSKQIVLPELPPSGHIAGFQNALATVHYRFAKVVDDWRQRGCTGIVENDYDCPMGHVSGLRGMTFLDACKRSLDTSSAPADVA